MSNTRPCIYFTRECPQLNDLCCLSLKLKIKLSSASPTATSSIQPQIIKCRELIFTEPEIIASPELGTEKLFSVIMQKSQFESVRLQAKFKKMCLEVSQVSPVTAPCYKSCLTYTMQAKLAPIWNKVGSFLVQGRDFLQCDQKLAAIRMDVNFACNELYLSLDAKVVKLSPVKLVDLDVCRQDVNEFLRNENYVIGEYSIERQWCYVLPSMKKGRIVSIHRRLPSNCPYKSYRDLRRHWKNSYGYRLPEEESGIYYQIFFTPLPHTLFTYPECCIRQRDFNFFPRPNQQPIIESFLREIHTRMPSVCGVGVTFRPKAHYVNTRINETKNVGTSVNLSLTQGYDCYPVVNRPLGLKQTFPPRESNVEGHYVLPQPLPVMKKMPQENKENMSQAVTTKSSYYTSNSQYSQSGDRHNNLVKCPRQTGHTKFVDRSKSRPVMKPINEPLLNRQSQAIGAHGNFPNVENLQQSGINGSTFIQQVKQLQPPKSGDDSLQNRPTGRRFQDERQTDSDSTNIFVKYRADEPGKINASQRIVPRFHPVKSALPPRATILSSNATRKIIPVFRPLVPTKQKASNSGIQAPNVARKIPTTQALPRQFTSFSRFKQTEVNNPKTENPSSSLADLLPAHADIHSLSGKDNQQKSNDAQNIAGIQASLKRMADSTSGDPKQKKPRTKPSIDTSVNIRALADNNQLNKVNSATLVSWMKNQGITCKSKDKKADLIVKINNFLNITAVEQ